MCITMSNTAGTTKKKSTKPKTASPLMVRLDADSKRYIARAAELRHLSVSDYVRTVMVPLSKREVDADEASDAFSALKPTVIELSAEDQLALWKAINAPPRKMTAARERIRKITRREP